MTVKKSHNDRIILIGEKCVNMGNAEEYKKTIVSLNELLKSSTIDNASVAKINQMKKENIEKFISEKHNYNICQRKNGLYQTKLPNRKTITAKTREALFNKLYEYYATNTIDNYSIADIFPLWVNERENGIGRKKVSIITSRHNISDYNTYLRNTDLVKKPITQVTKLELYTYYQEIVGDCNLLRSTLNNVKSIINGCFDYAVTRDIVEYNIARVVSTRDMAIKISDSGNKSYTDDQRELILKALESSTNLYDIAIQMMFCLSCRVGEILPLKWEDIDMQKHDIYIHHQIVRAKGDDGKIHFKDVPYTKSHLQQGSRHLPISPRLAKIIMRIPHESDYVFTGQRNGYMQTNYVNDHLKKVTEKLGIPYMSSHKIRFWSVTAQFSHGLDTITIQSNAGHADKSTTLHYGTHAMVDKVNAQKWNAVFN